MDTKVELYLKNKEKWTQELTRLRTILLDLNLAETIKWGAPTYVYKGKNVVGLAGFKNYFGLWFFQGGLLTDTAKVLQNAQEGKTQVMRQWRFFSSEEINENLIKLYVLETIDNFDAGREIKPKRNTKPLIIPKELKEILAKNKDLQIAFNTFSTSKKREFTEHIATAKRETTKQKRLEKIIPMILKGIGLYDKYRNC